MYKNANFDAFRSALRDADWDSCFYPMNIDKTYENWNDLFTNIVFNIIPNRHITIRLGDKPWYTTELHRLKRAKIGFIKRPNILIIRIICNYSERPKTYIARNLNKQSKNITCHFVIP